MYLIFYCGECCDDRRVERVQASGQLSSVLEPITYLQLSYIWLHFQ